MRDATEVGGDDDQVTPDVPGDAGDDGGVSAILAEMGTHDTFAALEARLADLEDELNRVEARSDSAAKQRDHELTVLRTRVDESLSVVRDAASAHREAAERTEALVPDAVAELEATVRALVDDLRDEVTPEVRASASRVDEVESGLTGRLDDHTADVDVRLEELDHRIAKLLADLDAAVASLAATVAHDRTDRDGAIDGLRTSVDARIDELVARHGEDREELVAGLEAIRGDLADGLATARTAARTADEELAATLAALRDEVTEVVSAQAQEATAVEPLRAEVTDLRTRLDVLQRIVAQAVREVASDLANRLATVAGDVGALRQRVDRQEQRLASIDRLDRRLRELAERPAPRTDAGLANRLDGVDRRLAELGEFLASLAERFEATDRLARSTHQTITAAVERTRERRGGGAIDATGSGSSGS